LQKAKRRRDAPEISAMVQCGPAKSDSEPEQEGVVVTATV
jgi:hypothetical protein